jgi:hypothetical protein
MPSISWWYLLQGASPGWVTQMGQLFSSENLPDVQCTGPTTGHRQVVGESLGWVLARAHPPLFQPQFEFPQRPTWSRWVSSSPSGLVSTVLVNISNSKRQSAPEAKASHQPMQVQDCHHQGEYWIVSIAPQGTCCLWVAIRGWGAARRLACAKSCNSTNCTSHIRRAAN